MIVTPIEKSPLTSPVGALMRPTNLVAPEDTLSRVASELRRNGTGLIPVAENDILRGVITDTSLAVALAEGSPLTAAAEIALVEPETIAPYATGAEALRRLAEGNGRPMVVVDDVGRPLGLISAVDLCPFPRRKPRPPMVGGMATPFGVYLTTGSVTAGARWWALMGTGATLMLILLPVNLAWIPVAPWLAREGLTGNEIGVVASVASMALFLLGMRLIPLSGTHGAEHQVVHAIERGEDLVPEVVRRMPRVHPRCGTNLAAGAFIFLGVFSLTWPPEPEFRLLLATVLTFIFWRPLGSVLQQFFTTRRPSERQLADGIRAGEELLDRYASAHVASPSVLHRLWRSGLAYVMAGSALCAVVAELIGKLFHVDLGLW